MFSFFKSFNTTPKRYFTIPLFTLSSSLDMKSQSRHILHFLIGALNPQEINLTGLLPPVINLTGLIFKVEFFCKIRIQHSMIITFKNNITRSHCSYCECLPGNNVNCFKFDINKNRTTICQNCRWIPRVISCSYCSHPFYSKDFSNVNTSEIGESIKVPGFNCVKCQCSKSGHVGCNYIGQERCYNVKDCVQMFERFRNSTSKTKYICNNCLFNGLPKSPYSIWMLNIRDLKILCSCKNTGEVSCKVKRNIGTIAIIKTCNNCSSFKSLLKQFQNKGLISSFPQQTMNKTSL